MGRGGELVRKKLMENRKEKQEERKSRRMRVVAEENR